MLAVVIPFRGGCEYRERALWWTAARYVETFQCPIVIGESPDGPFNRSAAIVDGALKTQADVLIVADGDCWCDGTEEAVRVVEAGAPWAIPHKLIRRLNEIATARVLAGEPFPRSPSDLNERPYTGHECGTLFVIRRDVLLDVPPDVRFVGWGHEDDALSIALRTLVGFPWRGKADLYHLFHPPQPRLTRSVGSKEGLALLRRYRLRYRNPTGMRQLVEESKEVTVVES